VRVITVIAHPDDEVLGCGATMARLVDEGHDVRVLLSLRRSDPRGVEHWGRILEDFAAACAVVGVEPVYADPLLEESSADYDVRSLHEVVLPHVEWADTVFTHWQGDVHQVHRTVSRSVEVATRPFRRRRNVYLFEAPTSTDQPFGQGFAPQMFVPVDESQARRKLEAMNLYSTEAAPGRRVEDLERRMRLRGAEIGAEYAEAFMVARQFHWATAGD
jgi:LmbE family N-acetylglucosaminyl deacetylase